MMKKGFTLVETILYIAIVIIMLGAVLPIILQIAGTGSKSNVTGKVYDGARYASERMIYEVRNASSVLVASSSFGVNFGRAPATLANDRRTEKYA